jgi:hypothetical protein
LESNTYRFQVSGVRKIEVGTKNFMVVDELGDLRKLFIPNFLFETHFKNCGFNTVGLKP